MFCEIWARASYKTFREISHFILVRRGPITQPFVESMAAITAIGAHGLIPEMVKELPAYLTAAVTCTGFNRADVREYTEGILKW